MTTLYEYWNTGDNAYGSIHSLSRRAQTFTPSVAHTVTSVKLKLWRLGSPGIVTINIFATDGAGKPTGSALAVGTTNGNAFATDPGSWIEITLGNGAVLAASTKYAIVVIGTNDGINDRVCWRWKTAGGYSGGQGWNSDDGGVTWTSAGTPDHMFEEWGYPHNWTAPRVSTQAMTNITTTTATGNGNVTGLGTPPATQYGHCWATFPNPTLADSKTEKGVPAATGAYTSALTGLLPNKIYYCCAYITNSVQTHYGVIQQFTTSEDIPIVTSGVVSNVAATTAYGHGTIDNLGGSPVTQFGVCWSTSANPTWNGLHTEEGPTNVKVIFASLMYPLVAATIYHMRAYATNAIGTGYGEDIAFFTLAVGAPIVTTELTTNVQPTYATGNGTIVNIGGDIVTEHGHCWDKVIPGTYLSPTTTDSGSGFWNKTTKGAGVADDFTSEITGLTAGTLYRTRAYAKNSYGTAYGDDKTFRLYNELAGNLRIQAEALCYTDKDGAQRYIIGTEFG